jgi:hypothetical protein
MSSPWTVVVQPEVDRWLLSLSTRQFARVTGQIGILAEEGVLLGEPHTRQLRGKLRELRITLNGRAIRITYFMASARRIILLTVFEKSQRHERAEIERADRAMIRWIERDTAG